MTEDQIERKVEREMDKLDRKLMDGLITQEQYDLEVDALERWSDQQYRHMERR